MRRLLLIPLCLALLTGTASATTVLRVNVDDLTDEATVVVRGKVLSVTSKWTKDKRTIHTLVKLSVAKTLKGTAVKEITITCPGGKVGGDEVPVAGVPKFAKGEEVIVFLWKNAKGEYFTLGWNQGRFRIEKDGKTGEEKAGNSLEGLSLVAPPDGKGGRRKVKRTADTYRVADLEKKVADRLEVLRKAEEARKAAEAAKKAEEAKKAAAEQEKKAAGERKEPVTDPEEEAEPEEPVVPDPSNEETTE